MRSELEQAVLRALRQSRDSVTRVIEKSQASPPALVPLSQPTRVLSDVAPFDWRRYVIATGAARWALVQATYAVDQTSDSILSARELGTKNDYALVRARSSATGVTLTGASQALIPVTEGSILLSIQGTAFVELDVRLLALVGG